MQNTTANDETTTKKNTKHNKVNYSHKSKLRTTDKDCDWTNSPMSRESNQKTNKQTNNSNRRQSK